MFDDDFKSIREELMSRFFFICSNVRRISLVNQQRRKNKREKDMNTPPET